MRCSQGNAGGNYVFEEGYDWHEVQKEVARIAKARANDFVCRTVWILRDQDGFDELYLEKVKGAEKKLAAVRDAGETNDKTRIKEIQARVL